MSDGADDRTDPTGATGSRPPVGTPPQAYRGEALGLPESGSGSLAPTGARVSAFLVDALASALVAALFVPHRGGSFAERLPGSWSLIPLALDYVGGVLVSGRTVGMYLFGLRLVRVDTGDAARPTARVDLLRILIRTVLLFLLVPALVFDRDARGLQDRLTGTAVVRA